MKKSQYRVVGLLGEGQFGKVYAAIHRDTGELVALKELNPLHFSTKKFLREIRILSGLEHPNIIRCHGVAHNQGKRYLVTEYCEGGTLRDLLTTPNSLTLEYKLKIIIDILDGLSYAHQEGIIHRDLKPENILLSVTSQGWKPKISDFGVAKIEREDTINNLGSNMGDTGSPAYMAPEQFYGKYSYSSDLYSVGIILYELILGDRPFSGSPYEIMFAHLNKQPPFPKNLPSHLRLILREALQKLPQHRFPTALEMKEKILQYVLDLNSDETTFYEKKKQNKIKIELLEEKKIKNDNFICLKSRNNWLYKNSENKVIINTFNIREEKINCCLKINYVFPDKIVDLKILDQGCAVVTKSSKKRNLYNIYFCQDNKKTCIPIESDYFNCGIANNGKWLAVNKTENNDQGFQIIKTKNLTPVTPLISEFIPQQIIIVDSCHGVAIYTQNEIEKNQTFFRLFNRRGSWYETYTAFVNLRKIVCHFSNSKVFLAGEKQKNNLILLKFHPFYVKRIPLDFRPDFYYPMEGGFLCASVFGNIALLDLEGDVVALSHCHHPLSAITPLNGKTIMIITDNNGQQKELIYRLKL